MRKLLIAEHSEDLVVGLEKALKDQWALSICSDGYSAADTLKYLEPDALIIDLNLPQKDGPSVLEECFPVIPPVILALTTFTSSYVERTASELGVGYMMRLPCQISQIKYWLAEMYAAQQKPSDTVARHLKALKINEDYSGYQCLLIAIPAFKEDPKQLLHKEIYPKIVELCGQNDERCVERVIRFAIHAAWERRDIRVWSHYFPLNEHGDIDFPSNRQFIARLSEKI